MSPELWIDLAAGTALLGLMAYAVLGGADFGGGVWDLLATGPRRKQQRDTIAHAMGPVWEANHVWLIFVIVVLFTCFPKGYRALSVAMFIPFHLVLVGIMLRGAAFVFRSLMTKGAIDPHANQGGWHGQATLWGWIFGGASVISPFMMGAAFGALTAGDVHVLPNGDVSMVHHLPWLRAYPIGCGLLALSTCAYLAAVYLMVESRGQLRDDFRRRAIIAGTATAALAAIVLVLASLQAKWFFEQLISWRSSPVIALGLLFFALSAWAVFTRRYQLSRAFAVGEVVLLLLGWGLAHRPYMIYPDLTLAESAGPLPTIKFMLISLPFGLMLLLPALWMLFSVFKGQTLPTRESGPDPGSRPSSNRFPPRRF